MLDVFFLCLLFLVLAALTASHINGLKREIEANTELLLEIQEAINTHE